MQKVKTFSVLFFTRKAKSDSLSYAIYARITVSGTRTELSLKRYCPVNSWVSSKGRAKGTSENIRVLNAYLDQVYGKLLDCHKQLLDEGKILSAKAIKDRYTGDDNDNRTLKDLISYHNTTMLRVLRAGTSKNYYTTEKYLNTFLLKKLKVNDIYLKQLNYRFICDFEQFLRMAKNKKNELALSNNGVMKHLERLKKMVNLSVKLEWIPKNPFHQFQLKFDKFDREYLTERELAKIENIEYSSERLQRIKDCFLFSCYTGLSYIDVRELTIHQLAKGIDNRYWIFTSREKTGQSVKIPILPKAMTIIEKYEGIDQNVNRNRLLPLYSNQKANKYLKEIAKDCEIHKNISFHVARHTFATTVMLSNGVPIETVSKLLGHSKLSTTQVYARVIESKISEDIGNLLNRIENKNNEDLKTGFR